METENKRATDEQIVSKLEEIGKWCKENGVTCAVAMAGEESIRSLSGGSSIDELAHCSMKIQSDVLSLMGKR